MDREYIEEAMDVFLESNEHVKVPDRDVRARMSLEFSFHCANGWAARQQATLDRAQMASES